MFSSENIFVDVETLREIIMKKTGMNRSKLDSLVEKKISEFSGLLTELGALYTIAKELGIEFEDKTVVSKISSLLPGEKDVTIRGTVVKVFGSRTYSKNGRKGKYASFIVRDDSGEIRVVVWDDMTNIVDRLSVGSVVEVSGGYVSEFRGNLSLSVGKNGRVYVIKDSSVEGVYVGSGRIYYSGNIYFTDEPLAPGQVVSFVEVKGKAVVKEKKDTIVPFIPYEEANGLFHDIIYTSSIREYERGICRKCKSPAESKDGKWICTSCGSEDVKVYTVYYISSGDTTFISYERPSSAVFRAVGLKRKLDNSEKAIIYGISEIDEHSIKKYKELVHQRISGT